MDFVDFAFTRSEGKIAFHRGGRDEHERGSKV
jgi:hypothetical protein